MDFAEELPAACPPHDAEDVELLGIYRLTCSDSLCESDFASHAALGKTPPKALEDACRWSSCSLTTNPVLLRKLSKLRHRYAVKLNIPVGAGLSKAKNCHVDFWRSKSFDLVAAVECVEGV